jgi:hypothetical protein
VPTLAIPALAAAQGAPGRPLVVATALIAPQVLTRSQPSSARSTALAGDGLTWQEYAADVPRFHGSAQRLLIEGQRTNSVPNPRAQGAVAGTPGTLPSNWNTIIGSGVSREVIGAVTVNGLPGLRLRFFGTPSANGNIQVQYVQNNVVAASAGQVWTHTAFYRLAAGSLANLTNIRIRTRVSGSSQDVLTVLSPAMDGTLRRYGHTVTCNAGATFIYAELTFVITNGQPVDGTVDFIAPQLELGPAASTPILPPVGTPGASTRGADVVTASLASLGVSGL